MNPPAHTSNYQHGNYFQSTSDIFPRSFQGRFYPERSSHINNEEHWCETCDRSFKTWKLLENHKQQHQKCNIDGCQFVAHPKVITKHIQMQHSSGIYKKIAKLNNPEEVQKWLEERKRKYPTQKNIEKKAAEMKERIERGEKMGLKRQHTGYKSDIHNKRLVQDKNKHSKAIRKTKVNNNKQPINLYNIPSPISNRKLKPFSGILDLLGEPTADDEEIPPSHFVIDDDEYTEFNKISLQREEPKICGVLSSLICNYGSSDEEENSNSDCLNKISTQNNNSNTERLEKPLYGGSQIIPENDINVVTDEDSGPEEQKITKTDVNNDSNQKQIVNVSNKVLGSRENAVRGKSEKKLNKVDRPIFRKPKPRKPPSSLLRKLLWKEMRQERNMVLQCIRYIVKNKYFDQNNT